MRQINDTTFISDNLGELKPLVTIGGKPVDKFIPNLNMSFHDDEFFINLNRRDKQATSATDKAEIDGIDKDIFYIDADGRFKWDIEFKERPLKNSWTWELKHADGIEFYYQGELTPEEIADGCERPLEVVGSYAVYCNKANNKYKTGKLCHIYRPFCYDINGESIYADLLIADGQLTIAIDETWLNNAVYPVRLDPTIGYTTAGASTTGRTNTSAAFGQLLNSATAAMEITKIYYYGSAGVSGETVHVSTYNVSAGMLSSRKHSQLSITVNTSAAWYSVSTSQSLSSDTYNVASAWDGVSSGQTVFINYDSGTGTNKTNNATQYLDATWSNTGTSTARISLYAEYTESGGSPIPAIINNYRQQGVM